jgi:hypothetical protein
MPGWQFEIVCLFCGLFNKILKLHYYRFKYQYKNI